MKENDYTKSLNRNQVYKIFHMRNGPKNVFPDLEIFVEGDPIIVSL